MNITIKHLKKIGLEHHPELDFGDDGTKFKVLSYKGVPVTYAKANDEYYISIRFDYSFEINGKSLDYSAYSKLPSYSLTDDFNGVANVDLDQLKANLEVAAKDLNIILGN